MENYTTRLQEQAKALQADIDQMVANIKNQEIILEGMRNAKTLAFR